MSLAELALDLRRLPPTPELTEAVSKAAIYARGQRLMAAYARMQRRLTAQMARNLRGIFEALGEAVASQATDIPLTEAEKPSADDRAWVEQVMAATNLSDFKLQLAEEFEAQWLAVATEVTDTASAHIGVGLRLPDPAQIRIVQAGGRRAGMVDIAADTKRALFKALSAAREEGLGPIEAARKIREYVPAGRFAGGAGVKYRAEMIARTEILHASRMSSLEAYASSDTIVGHMAHDGLLGDADDECEARDGEIFSLTDAEAESENEHINGTLGWSPVLKGEI